MGNIFPLNTFVLISVLELDGFKMLQNVLEFSKTLSREQRFFFSLLKFRPKTKYYIYNSKMR